MKNFWKPKVEIIREAYTALKRQSPWKLGGLRLAPGLKPAGVRSTN